MENKINEVGAGVEKTEIIKQKAAGGTATLNTNINNSTTSIQEASANVNGGAVEKGNKFKLPRQLRRVGFGFCKVKYGAKRPFETEWQKKPYSYEEIEQYMSEGYGSYGVQGGYGGLIIIDADSRAVVEAVEQNLPETFTIKSHGDRRHYYFLCSEIKNKICFDDKITPTMLQEGETHYGEIISGGGQVVGPGAIHPEAQTFYEVVADVEIATVTYEQVMSAIVDFINMSALHTA